MLLLLSVVRSVQAQQNTVPPALSRLASEIVVRHPSVAGKRANVMEAEANIDAAKAQYLPTPSVQINQLASGGHSTTLAVTQPLWAAGRIHAGLDAARARGRSADGAVVETQNILALRVADLYQGYLASRLRVSAQQDGINRLVELADVMNRRVEAGISASADRELANSRLTQVRSDLELEEASGRTLLAQLGQMAGRPVSRDEVSLTLAPIGTLEDESVLLDRALANNPAIQRAGADIEAAVFDAKVQRASQWPTLSLQAARTNYSQPALTRVNSSQVYLTLQYLPGAGLASGALSRASLARAESLKDGLEATRRDIADGLMGDYERYRAARVRFGNALSVVAASREVLNSYRRLFVAGKRSWLDLVNAARELTEAQLALADLSAALTVGPFRLQLRSGDTLWQQ